MTPMVVKRLLTNKWWQNLSIFKKLYVVVGIMTLLIAFELVTLRFATQTLSAVRAFVGGEGLWSKAQKNAVANLEKYALTADPRYYANFLENMRVPLGDHKARVAMEGAVVDTRLVYEGFIEGRIHPDDIQGLIQLFTRFQNISYLKRAINLWRDADNNISELIAKADDLHSRITKKEISGQSAADIILELEDIDHRLTQIEDEFSYSLGEGSRWLESTVLLLLILAIMAIEGSGLYLTFSFSRYLSKGLKEITAASEAIAQGEIDKRIDVPTEDEIGKLAKSINKIAVSLQESAGGRVQAEAANKWKSLFLANMSHEIRSPLGAMIGFTELLQDPALSKEERNRYLNIVRKTGENLNKIINDILDLSKVEAGRLEFEAVEFDFPKFIEDIQDILGIRALEKDVRLIFEKAGAEVKYIKADPVRIRQIILNLVYNAIKFSPNGGFVRVSYGIADGFLKFTVQDNGAGIPFEQRSKLFQPFGQVGNQKQGGTGLGLFLSRRLATAMGGDIALDSSIPGHGSIFSAKIRVQVVFNQLRVESLKTAANNDDLLLNKKILVVDDSPENQLLFKRLLSRRGALVTLANDGEEAVALVAQDTPDLILMDMMMPVMDGYQATQLLRSKGYKKPIIALTAHAMKEARIKCLEAGCTTFLTKPIQSAELIRAVGTHLSDAYSQQKAGSYDSANM
jgi:signal transduction histidine kinase/CheY-like chemotaxis protein